MHDFPEIREAFSKADLSITASNITAYYLRKSGEWTHQVFDGEALRVFLNLLANASGFLVLLSQRGSAVSFLFSAIESDDLPIFYFPHSEENKIITEEEIERFIQDVSSEDIDEKVKRAFEEIDTSSDESMSAGILRWLFTIMFDDDNNTWDFSEVIEWATLKESIEGFVEKYSPGFDVDIISPLKPGDSGSATLYFDTDSKRVFQFSGEELQGFLEIARAAGSIEIETAVNDGESVLNLVFYSKTK